MNNIILDSFFGAVILGSFSYLSSIHTKNNNYIKILAYLWAIPCILFYLLHIASRKNKQAVYDLVIHALLGLSLSIIALLLTLYFIDLEPKNLILYNFLFLMLCVFVYFYFKIYQKI